MANSKLPERPSLEHLKKLARNRLQDLRRTDPDAKLATALLHVAREYGFPSWRALKAQLDGHRARRIENPLMRFLAVTDFERSIAFYRDVLGFEVKQSADGIEAVLGPARIRIGKEGYATGDLEFKNPKPPGSMILFLQCDDVSATRALFQSRGASPSEIEKVNWIKMRMFEIRDPDNNVLWFGQTYHKQQDSPSRGRAQPRGIRQALPELPFDNVPAAVSYYRDVLGFASTIKTTISASWIEMRLPSY